MSQYVKDSSRPQGWKVISYRDKDKRRDDGAPITAESMDEGADEGSGDEQPETDQMEMFMEAQSKPV